MRNYKYTVFSQVMPIVLLLMTGCTPVISKQVREHVRPDITFTEVLNDPERYKGQMMLLSGVILESQNTPEGTLLKVLQHPAGFRGKPKDTDESEGGGWRLTAVTWLSMYMIKGAPLPLPERFRESGISLWIKQSIRIHLFLLRNYIFGPLNEDTTLLVLRGISALGLDITIEIAGKGF